MIRAARICVLAVVGQMRATILNPILHLVGFIVTLIIILPLFVFLAFSSRATQNRVIESLLHDARVGRFVRERLHLLLSAEDLAVMTGHAGHEIICWDCHHQNGCVPPKRGEKLDHGCHRGACPYERCS